MSEWNNYEGGRGRGSYIRIVKRRGTCLETYLEGKPNPTSIHSNPYSHHVYLENGVYDKRCIENSNCNQSFHRHIPYYGEIPFFDENLFKIYFIR
jgi:hypothetical protein